MSSSGGDAPGGPLGYFSEALQEPCRGCSAPCCRMVIIPMPAPEHWADLDYFRYMLGFPTMEAIIAEDGAWSIVVHQTCTRLDAERNLCTVHGTPAQPRTCADFSAHGCWYKRNFTGQTRDVLRLDLVRFERVLAMIEFNEAGEVVRWPGWKQVKEHLDGATPVGALSADG